jgi:hypothetical protein
MSKPGTAMREARPGILARAGAKIGLGHREVEYQPPLSPVESRELLDRRSRASLGISGDEFVRRLRAGDLPDTSAVHGLAMLAGEVLSPAGGTR